MTLPARGRSVPVGSGAFVSAWHYVTGSRATPDFFFIFILEQLTLHLHRRVTRAVGAMDRLYQAQFPQNRDEQTLPRGFDGSHLASRRLYPPSLHGTYHTQYSGFLLFFVFHVNQWRKRDLAPCDSSCKPSDKKSTHCWALEMGSPFYASFYLFCPLPVGQVIRNAIISEVI